MSKGATDLVSALHHLRMAFEYFESFYREIPQSSGGRLCRGYANKCEWVYKDLITHPHFPKEVIEGIRSEWTSDVFTGQAIQEKIVLLNPTEREIVEKLIDALIAGETVEFVQE